MNNQIFSPWGDDGSTDIQQNTGGHTYKVTGLDRDGRRFRIETSNRIHALGINLWCGSVWEFTRENKWRLIKRVYN